MQDLAKLSDLAAAEIDDLTAAGIILSPAEVVEINALAWQVESPHTRLHLSRGVPVFVAGITLWPMTLYAADWYCRIGANLKGSLAELSLAYAMTHAYDDGDALLCDIETAPKKVKRWVKSLRCTRNALICAVGQVLQQDDKPPAPQREDDTPMTVGDFSANLAAMTGDSPDFWERRCAASYTHSVLTAITMQNRADKRPCPNDPKILATRALGALTDRIRERSVQDV